MKCLNIKTLFKTDGDQIYQILMSVLTACKCIIADQEISKSVVGKGVEKGIKKMDTKHALQCSALIIVHNHYQLLTTSPIIKMRLFPSCQHN